MGTVKDIAQELSDLGIEVTVSHETAEAQWKMFAREYRLVGERGTAFEAIRGAMITAIMVGDAQIEECPAGVAVRQFVKHPQGGCPKEIVYNPPSTIHVARGGTDDTPLSQKWCRVAASLSGNREGDFGAWLMGRDYSLMETIAQLFTLA